LSAFSVFPGELVAVGIDADTGVVAERVEVLVELTDVVAQIAAVQVAVGRDCAATAAAPVCTSTR